MRTETITLTPQTASEFLKKNTQNRKVKKDRVLSYAKLMTNAEWVENGMPIVFDENGTLVDGQHRLLAVVRSGVTLNNIVVVRGVSELAKATIDIQATRTGADVLHMSNVKNAVNVSAGIKKYLMLLSGYQNTNSAAGYRGISHIDLQNEYYQSPEQYQHLCNMGSSFYKCNHQIISNSDFIGFYKLFLTRHSADVVNSFFDSIHNKEGVGNVLFDKLIQDKYKAKRKMSVTEKNALIIKAFNSHVSGKVVKLLKWSVEEQFPKVA